MEHIPRFHIRSFGCKVNRAESERIAAALIARGWLQAPPELADIAIVNTCTVTGEADAKNRKAIRALLAAGCGHVIVTGCSANVDTGVYAAIDARVAIVRGKDEVAQRACELLGMPASAELGADTRALAAQGDEGFRTRVDVKVQDGCDNACSYCIVHTARGPAHSVPAHSVIADIDALSKGGTQEAVLVGIDLGAYRSEGLDLASLLEALLEHTDIGRLRLSSIEPQNLSDHLISVLASAGGRVCRHLHLCLQSGSDKVLREMNRSYTTGEFCARVETLRRRVPGIALSTDVIAGFPGETDDDFEATCALVRRCSFMRLHVFRYSKRPGTPAAVRNDQVLPQVSAARAACLREIGAELADADARSRIGSCEQVIVERSGTGTSESYHAVTFDAAIETGALVCMRFTGYEPLTHTLLAQPC